MVQEKYPAVTLIANTDNVGFAKANNQAIRLSSGEYVLLLNPDTLVQEDTFEKVVSFMDEHEDAGGLGVKMIDGKGNFLPESKRGLPTPSVAFYKIFGFSKLFPRSKTFGRYHLSFLDKDKVHEVDVLSGAFMLLRKETLDKTGLLDETYFMYGEDIDLSYCITKAGYKNYYFPETTIIHYKGESTKKSSVNYVFVFYRAMLIFARKHFSSRYASLLSLLINTAIYFRAGVAIIYRMLKAVLYPMHDFIFIYAGIRLIKDYWEKHIIGVENYYPFEYVNYILPAYVIFWLFTIYYLGGYEKPVRIINIIKGLLWGLIPVLVFYALLPEDLRYSRAILLLGFAWAMIILPSYRFLFSLTQVPSFALHKRGGKRIIIISDKQEFYRVSGIIKEVLPDPVILGYVTTQSDDTDTQMLGTIDDLNQIILPYKPDEVIFCSANMPTQSVIEKMLILSAYSIDFKIANPDSIAIVGSNSIDSAGDLYRIDNNAINKPTNKRFKRTVDILLAVFSFLFWWILIFIVKNKVGFFRNMFQVLLGIKTWVGYQNARQDGIPIIKKSVLPPCQKSRIGQADELSIRKMNMAYAKDYRVFNDIYLYFNNLSYLGD
jgi:GT2 family glycosyltransferase